MESKICTKCGLEKLLNDYYNHTQSSDGKQTCCKSCTKKKQAEYRKNNKEKIKEARKTYYENHKEYRKEKFKKDYNRAKLKVFDLLGNKCVYCDCNDPDALEINHINGLEETKRKGGMNLFQDILKNRISLDKLELTCAVCNRWHYLVKLKGLKDGWTITYNHNI